MFDVAALRREFPALSPPGGGAHVALDNAAATLVLGRAIEAWAQFHQHAHAAGEIQALLDAARRRIALRLGADAGEVVFCGSTTQAIHLVAAGWAETMIGADDEILVSSAEHVANLAPWHALARRRNAHLRVIALDAGGAFPFDAFVQGLTPRTRLVAVAHVSNAIGAVLPVRDIVGAAQAAGARVLVDGAQAMAHRALDFGTLGADFYAFPAHKTFAPGGLGVLLARRERLQEMQPVLRGANAFAHFTDERSELAPTPGRFEGGSANVAGILALAEALEFAHGLGWEGIVAHERRLAARLDAGLAALPRVRALPSPPDAVPIRAFTVQGHDAAQIVQRLGEQGIRVRAGALFADTLLRQFGVDAAIRVSAALYNTDDDIDRFLAALSGMR